MTDVKIYNSKGESNTTLKLNEDVFGVAPKADVVHQVYVALRANARQAWADTKDRGEVSGGGKKPWKQKGTGRARHGSNRSPIWKGGGITFGPLTDRNYGQKINKKMSLVALAMCFGDKAQENTLLFVDELKLDGKAKTFAGIKKSLPCAGRSTLVVVETADADFVKSVANISKTDFVRASDVNVIDMLHHQYVLVTKEALQVIEKRLSHV